MTSYVSFQPCKGNIPIVSLVHDQYLRSGFSPTHSEPHHVTMLCWDYRVAQSASPTFSPHTPAILSSNFHTFRGGNTIFIDCIIPANLLILLYLLTKSHLALTLCEGTSWVLMAFIFNCLIQSNSLKNVLYSVGSLLIQLKIALQVWVPSGFSSLTVLPHILGLVPKTDAVWFSAIADW